MCFHPTSIQIYHTPEPLNIALVERRSALHWPQIHTPITLLIAPPGYGKSCLLQQWQQHSHEQKQSTAFMRLHPSANHLPTLLQALARLLHLSVIPHTLAQLYELLSQAASERNIPAVIFIDNLEALTQRQSAAALETLLTLTHHGTRFAFAGRTNQHLRLAQWQLNQQVTLLQVNDLILTKEEVPEVSSQCLDALEHWPLAVFCYAQQMAQSTQPLAKTLALLEHYFDELLDALYSPTEQRLLMISALEPHFSLESLSQLSAKQQWSHLVNQWQGDNIFLHAADKALSRFAFMPLFRNYLNKRLQQQHPVLAQRLQAKLSQAPQHHDNPTVNFTHQEQQMLAQITQGKTNKDIAAELQISEGTVKWHLHNLYRKMQVTSRAQAILKATEGFGSHYKVAL